MIWTAAGPESGSVISRLYRIIVPVAENETEIPYGYYLSQNYPNPFNPVTKINYKLQVTNFVSLKVYDVLGNEIAMLVNMKQNAGTHNIEFDGSSFASGIYFYSLYVNNVPVETRKMMLLKWLPQWSVIFPRFQSTHLYLCWWCSEIFAYSNLLNL